MQHDGCLQGFFFLSFSQALHGCPHFAVLGLHACCSGRWTGGSQPLGWLLNVQLGKHVTSALSSSTSSFHTAPFWILQCWQAAVRITLVPSCKPGLHSAVCMQHDDCLQGFFFSTVYPGRIKSPHFAVLALRACCSGRWTGRSQRRAWLLNVRLSQGTASV